MRTLDAFNSFWKKYASLLSGNETTVYLFMLHTWNSGSRESNDIRVLNADLLNVTKLKDNRSLKKCIEGLVKVKLIEATVINGSKYLNVKMIDTTYALNAEVNTSNTGATYAPDAKVGKNNPAKDAQVAAPNAKVYRTPTIYNNKSKEKGEVFIEVNRKKLPNLTKQQ